MQALLCGFHFRRLQILQQGAKSAIVNNFTLARHDLPRSSHPAIGCPPCDELADPRKGARPDEDDNQQRPPNHVRRWLPPLALHNLPRSQHVHPSGPRAGRQRQVLAMSAAMTMPSHPRSSNFRAGRCQPARRGRLARILVFHCFRRTLTPGASPLVNSTPASEKARSIAAIVDWLACTSPGRISSLLIVARDSFEEAAKSFCSQRSSIRPARICSLLNTKDTPEVI